MGRTAPLSGYQAGRARPFCRRHRREDSGPSAVWAIFPRLSGAKVTPKLRDVASRLSSLTYDGQSFASNIVYNAASQTTSLSVGTGTNQVNESYRYSAQTGLLDGQAATRNGATIFPTITRDQTESAPGQRELSLQRSDWIAGRSNCHTQRCDTAQSFLRLRGSEWKAQRASDVLNHSGGWSGCAFRAYWFY